MATELKNKFTGMVEVANPPIKTFTLVPNKDALLMKEEPRANYGKSSLMMVNPSISRGESASIYNFTGLEEVPAKVWENLISVNFRVNYTNNTGLKSNVNASLYRYDYPDDWEEDYVYWESAPLKGKHITDTVITKTTSYTNFDIKDIILDKKSNHENDVGFYIESTDTPAKRVVSINSREDSSKSPKLIFTYYDIPGALLIRTLPCSVDIMGIVGKSVYYDNKNKVVDENSDNIARVEYTRNLEIASGELTVDSFITKQWINGIDPTTGEGTLYIPKYTPFKIDITNKDGEISTAEAGAEYRDSKKVFDIVEDIESYESDDITSTATSGDLITGTTGVCISGPFALINGTTRVWKGSAFDITFKDSKKEVLYSGADVDDIDKWYPDPRVITTESEGDLITCPQSTWEIDGKPITEVTQICTIVDPNLYIINEAVISETDGEITGTVDISGQIDPPVDINGNVGIAIIRYDVTETKDDDGTVKSTESEGDLITCPIGEDESGESFLRVDGRVGVTTYYDAEDNDLGTKYLADTEFDHSDHDIQISGTIRVPKYLVTQVEFFDILGTSLFVNRAGMDIADVFKTPDLAKKTVGDPAKEIACEKVTDVDPIANLNDPEKTHLWIMGSIGERKPVQITGKVSIAQPVEMDEETTTIACEMSDVLPDDYDLADCYIVGAVGYVDDPIFGPTFNEDQEIVTDKYSFDEDPEVERYTANDYDELTEAIDMGNEFMYTLGLVSKLTWYDKLGKAHKTEIPEEDTLRVDWDVQITGIAHIAQPVELTDEDSAIICDKVDVPSHNMPDVIKAGVYVAKEIESGLPEIECTKVDGMNPSFNTAEELHLYIAVPYEDNVTNTDNILTGDAIVSYEAVFPVNFTNSGGTTTYDESYTLATAYDSLSDMSSTTSTGDLIKCDAYKWNGSTVAPSIEVVNLFTEGTYIVGHIVADPELNTYTITGKVDIANEIENAAEINGTIDGIIYPVFKPDTDGDLITCDDMNCGDPVHETDVSKIGLYLIAEVPVTDDMTITCDQSPAGTELDDINLGIIGIMGKTTWYNTDEEVVDAVVDEDGIEDYESEDIAHTDYEPTDMQIEGHVDAAYMKQAWIDCDYGKMLVGDEAEIPDGIDCPNDDESLVIIAGELTSYGFIL